MDDTDLFTVAQVRAFDRAAIEARGIAGYTLMQRAAAFAWSRLRLRWPQARRIVVICGSGNNGGDGYVLARLARTEGLDAEVVALAEPRAGSDAARAYADWAAVGGATAPADASIAPADVYVDAIFGTGLARPPDGAARAWIERLDAARNGVLALDVPSGVDADSGDVPGVAVRATETASFVAHKRGLFTGAALEYRGALSLDALEIPAPVFDAARFLATLQEKRGAVR